MRAVQDILQSVVSRADPLAVLASLLKHTVALMDTAHSFFFQYDTASDELKLKVGSGIYRDHIGLTVNRGDGLVGKIWQDQTPMIVNDYPQWPGRHPAPTWDAVQSVAGVPLQAGKKILGVIGILHTEVDRRIEDHEFELLKRFAELATMTLDTADVHRKLKTELQERRQTEKALTASEERYRTVVEDLNEFVLRWQPDGQVIFANEVYCRYKRKTKAQIIGRNVDGLFSQAAYDLTREIIARLTPRDPVEQNEILTYGPDGKPIWEEWSDRGIFAADGRLIEIQSVGRNITERKMDEKALRESEYRFRSFFDSNPQGIVLVDLNGHILDANRSLLKMTGLRLEEIRGRAYQDLVQARYHEPIAHQIDLLVNGRRREAPLEIEYINKSEDRLHVEVRGWVITDEESRPVALGAFIRDMTREKRLAADKAALELQLQQTQKMEAIGTLAGGIAHDFNNILSGILGYAELAATEVDDDDASLRHFISGILDACHRARSLVQQILKFSRRDDTKLAPLMASPLVKEAIQLLRSTLPATIQIRARMSAERDTVIADATQLHQVIMNLVTNAYQAMRNTGGMLTVVLENRLLTEPRYYMTLSIPPGAYLKLSITDTGPGIPEELRDRIFEPYFTTKEKQEGTGLGLSVTYGIVKNLNGLIEVEQSIPGATTFAVYLPLKAKAGAADPEASFQLPSGRSQRILCVDDEQVFLDVVKRQLGGLGYRVTVCRSSARALAEIEARPAHYDLIITDLSMPELTGVQLAAAIRRIDRAVPIVLCTGGSETVTADTAKQLGIVGLLLKPVTRRELAQSVHHALAHEPGPPRP